MGARGAGVSSRRWGAMYGATGADGLGAGGTVPSGRKGVIGGSLRPPARVASSDCAAISRSGERSPADISRSAAWARSADGPMAPLAIERMVTTRPGAMFGGAGAPAGSTPKAAQTAMPHERTSARRSLCDGAPRTAAAGCASAGGTGISCTTAGFPLRRTAFQPCPAPGATSSISFGFGSDSGIQRCMVPFRHVAYVIVQPCIDVKDASCVEVCPVDCIHTDDAANMYYIDPDECIDCGACVDPCPVDAIFPEDEVPEQWRNFIQINADYFKNR